MRGLLEGVGIAFIILAICIGFRGCISDKPLIGPKGIVYDNTR